MWAAYEASWEWPAWDAETLGERIQALYGAMRSAVVQEGLTDEGIAGVGGTKSEIDRFVWGEEAEALIAERAEHQETERGAHRWPWGVIAWADHDRSTMVLVISDWDMRIPREVIAWGDHAEACIGALEEVLETEGSWC